MPTAPRTTDPPSPHPHRRAAQRGEPLPDLLDALAREHRDLAQAAARLAAEPADRSRREVRRWAAQATLHEAATRALLTPLIRDRVPDLVPVAARHRTAQDALLHELDALRRREPPSTNQLLRVRRDLARCCDHEEATILPALRDELTAEERLDGWGQLRWLHDRLRSRLPLEPTRDADVWASPTALEEALGLIGDAPVGVVATPVVSVRGPDGSWVSVERSPSPGRS